MATYTTWHDILDHLHDLQVSLADKDHIIRPIIWSSQKEPDADWNTVLTLVFWPALVAMHRRSRTWDSDDEQRWTNLYWSFLESVNGVDLARRPDRLWSKVRNDTFHRFYEHYSKRWAQSKDEVVLPAKKWAAIERRNAGSGAHEIEHEVSQSELMGHLCQLRGEGKLSDADYKLLMATLIESDQVVEYASDHDLNYETVRKRRQRLIQRLDFLKILAESLSPQSDKQPPLECEGRAGT